MYNIIKRYVENETKMVFFLSTCPQALERRIRQLSLFMILV